MSLKMNLPKNVHPESHKGKLVIEQLNLEMKIGL